MNAAVYITCVLSIYHAAKENSMQVLLLILCVGALTEYVFSAVLDLQCIELELDVDSGPFTVKIAKCLTLDHILFWVPCKCVYSTTILIICDICAGLYVPYMAGNCNKFNVIEFPVMPSFLSILMRLLYNMHQQILGNIRFSE
jgi:hypothetical protein